MKIITVEELKHRLDAGESLNLLDVREQDERDEFNIGGRFLPIGRIRLYETESIEDWKNREVIVYCRSGNRSGQAALWLEQAGFDNGVHLAGGMLAWRNGG
ncbi:MAG: rhodanese-like domain-containing protein [Chitinophagaceae bacterium]|jgi:rhodanese-related sulfurtransferase|nr:rhodanese-like domain-containing protein [Chitinophagaceae bacterium]